MFCGGWKRSERFFLLSPIKKFIILFFVYKRGTTDGGGRNNIQIVMSAFSILLLLLYYGNFPGGDQIIDNKKLGARSFSLSDHFPLFLLTNIIDDKNTQKV